MRDHLISGKIFLLKLANLIRYSCLKLLDNIEIESESNLKVALLMLPFDEKQSILTVITRLVADQSRI